MIKIRFVRNLDVVGVEAVCLWWCDEVHVDEKLRDSPRLMEILNHEAKHYRIMQQVIREKSWWKREMLLWYNMFWDWYDCARIQISKILRMKDYAWKGWGMPPIPRRRSQEE